MTGRTTEARFADAVEHLNIGQQTRDIAHGVLVEGLSQSHFVRKLGITKGAVSQAVGRVRAAIEAASPRGLVRVTATVTAEQARTIRAWEAAALSQFRIKQGQSNEPN
ncbi:transcriptional regulator [Xanthomonas campestris pv. campestris]|uniref:TrfB-related DNA-binding protein n=1 Tax=Xanthomonas campestris TaxID=339 RepID=UPI001E5554C3|nr:TrfB-related DNA-binding protein [Xanthomonas campestris]MCD0253139.1 transcriptional regulator [Xanthomonas campestris pv. campestris]